jgi:isoleucyl-tRNA synthetase
MYCVNDDGLLTNCPAVVDCGDTLAGLSVFGPANDAIVRRLREAGSLRASVPYKHRYPYDWRSGAFEPQFASSSPLIDTPLVAQENQ